MPFAPQPQPHVLIYLITSGQTTPATRPVSRKFCEILDLVSSAVTAQIDLVQIREKQLHVSVLYELAKAASAITDGTVTKLLVNDRADVAAASGADGVHLTGTSLPATVVRRSFGPDFLIGVSTHSLQDASAAQREGADFAVFGPVFDTDSKKQYGAPVGLQNLASVSSALTPFPILALGGVTVSSAESCIRAGARGVAGISMLQDAERLGEIVNAIRAS